MILANGLVMDEHFKLVRCDLEVQGEKITRIAEKLDGQEKIDLKGKYILPGFIDTHVHGAYGVRLSDENPDLRVMTRFEATQGVTALAITTASSEFEDLLRQIDLAVEAAGNSVGAKIVGIHAEGPFISKTFKGAMNEQYIIAPDLEKLDSMMEHGRGYLKIITVAPEVDHALDLIRHARQKGVVVSMGHTDATYEQACKAIEAGATQTTHTFNAMRAFNHREPGVLGAALTNHEIICEMICDYVHLHPVTARLIYDLKGANHIHIVSDSGHAAGLNLKQFMVDGKMRYLKDGVVRLEDGTIAGSAKTVADGVWNLITSGIPMGDVSKMASYTPARILKLDHEMGSIAVGKLADLVVLDGDYRVEYTFINGECVYKRKV